MIQKIGTIKELPVSERPYEKCEQYGPSVLSDAELLAVIIRTGSVKWKSIDLAQHILNVHPVHKGIVGLYHLTLEELMNVNGIGRVKAIQLLSLVEFSKRISRAVSRDGIKLQNPQSIVNYYMETMRHLPREQMVLLMFNTKCVLLKDIKLSEGTVNSSLASPRELFIEALRYEAVFIVLLHNHPSGDPAPSKQDLAITRRIKEAGELIGIHLSDHIILGDQCYVSLKERGIV